MSAASTRTLRETWVRALIVGPGRDTRPASLVGSISSCTASRKISSHSSLGKSMRLRGLWVAMCKEARRLLPALICVRVSRRRQGSMSVGESLGTATIVRKPVSLSVMIGESRTIRQQPWWFMNVSKVLSVGCRDQLACSTRLHDLARAYLVSGPCQ